MLARIGLALALVLPASAQTVQLVSQSTTGVQGNGDSRAPRISADGEWVVFKSDASTLVPGDSNGVGDIFLRHLDSGTTTMISLGVGAAPANGESFSPAISADGSVIAFQSSASNLVAGDTNGKADVFVWEAGVITRVSLGTGGVQANGASDKPSVSGDGRYVAFESVGSNLIVGDTNGASDIFRFDRVTGSVVRASVSSTGAEANGASHTPWLSGNGAVVAFDSLATNLVGGDTNASSDVFARDLVSGTTVGATVLPGLVGNGSSDTASISADGQLVAFRSDATNLVVGDSNGMADVFLADPWNQQLWRVSEGTGGVQGNGAANFPQLSPDGFFVAFTSAASNLVTGDTNARDDVFVHDVAAAKTKRISIDAYGVPGNGHSRAPSVASGGASTAFKSDATNLTPGDANGTGDVFVRRPAAMTWFVDASATPPGLGTATSPFATLQSALGEDVASSGDTILLAAGTYYGGFDALGRSLTMRGTFGSSATILDGQGVATVLAIHQSAQGTTTLDGVTVQNGLATRADPATGDLIGGGVYIEGGALRLVGSVVRGCSGDDGGAVFAEDCDVEMESTSLIENRAVCRAAGLHCRGGRLQAIECAISDNIVSPGGCPLGGVGLLVESDDATIQECTFERNEGFNFTSGIGAWISGSDATIIDSTFFGNRSYGSGEGAGAYVEGPGIVVDQCAFIGNHSYGALSISGSGFTVSNSVFHGNSGSDNDGGGMITGGVGGTVANCRFERNDADWAGGAIRCYTRLSITDSVFVENSAGFYTAGGGGAVFGDVDFARCVFARNTAVGWGPSVHAGLGTYVQCTFVDNPPNSHDTFAWGSSFDSCIMVGNGALPPGSWTAAWSIADFDLGGSSNLIGAPGLWDPDVYDFSLVHSSPCIDAANPALPLDPDGSRADMGAIPFDPNYCGTPRVYCTAKVNSLGCTPSISWTGTPSLTGPNDDFHITASNVLNNKNGLLFWGTQDFGAPFQGGTLCVKPPIVRTDVQVSGGNPPPNDCSGTYDFHLSQSYMGASLFQVGTTIHAQYWSRDPGFSPPNNVGLTDALRVVVCP